MFHSDQFQIPKFDGEGKVRQVGTESAARLLLSREERTATLNGFFQHLSTNWRISGASSLSAVPFFAPLVWMGDGRYSKATSVPRPF